MTVQQSSSEERYNKSHCIFLGAEPLVGLFNTAECSAKWGMNFLYHCTSRRKIFTFSLVVGTGKEWMVSHLRLDLAKTNNSPNTPLLSLQSHIRFGGFMVRPASLMHCNTCCRWDVCFSQYWLKMTPSSRYAAENYEISLKTWSISLWIVAGSPWRPKGMALSYQSLKGC